MEPQSDGRASSRALIAFATETVLLFGLLTLPYVLLGGGNDVLVSALFAFACLLWPIGAAIVSPQADTPSRARVVGFAALQLVFGAGVVFSIVLVVGQMWVAMSYDLGGFAPGETVISWPTGSGLALAAVSLIGTGACIVLASMLPLRRDGERAVAFVRRLCGGAFRAGLAPLLVMLAFGLIVIGNLNAGATISALSETVMTMTPHRTTPVVWELALLFPTIPVGLFVVAMLLAAHRRMVPVALSRYRRPPAEQVAAGRGTAALALVNALGAAFVFGGILNAIHIGTVAALGLVTELEPSTAVSRALSDWVDSQRAAGRSNVEIAAALQAHGRWSPDAPHQGLVALLPGLAGSDASSPIAESACRFTVAAATLDTKSLHSIDWMERDHAEQDVRYCLAIACPNPTIWIDEPMMMLYSSHPSRNRYWVENVYMDVFAMGVAEPGGYCTTEGTLAERFQG